MQAKNSSNCVDDSDPDHFGTSEISDRFLCIVVITEANLSLSLVISKRDSANSSRSLFSIMLN